MMIKINTDDKEIKDGGIQWLTNPSECCMATGYYWVQCTEYNNI